MEFDLKRLAKEKLIMVAHRGIWGGNIPCNTMAAYEIALKQGADMIEIDVDASADGQLFIFHPTMEMAHLHRQVTIGQLPSSEVKKLRYVNVDDTETQFGLETLDDVLENFKGRCYINIDKFCNHPVEIGEAIRRHGMSQQILVKTSPDEEALTTIEEYCPDIQYMCMIEDPKEIDRVKKHKLNYIGNEVLFQEDSSVFADREFIRQQHREGMLVWCNAIVYDYNRVISAGHNDDTSLIKDPQKGWGWIAERGYDFMQTDWMGMAVDYLTRTGQLYHDGRGDGNSGKSFGEM